MFINGFLKIEKVVLHILIHIKHYQHMTLCSDLAQCSLLRPRNSLPLSQAQS